MKASRVLGTTWLLVLLLGLWGGPAAAQTLADYSALPPFIGTTVTPNVLLLVDNSGSMNNCAYPDPGEEDCLSTSGSSMSDQYDSSQKYFGYFDPSRCYEYASSRFRPAACSSSTWNGNFLNWLTMRRIDITKWVMTGGQCNSIRSSEDSCTVLRGQDRFSSNACCRDFFKRFDLTGLAPSWLAGVRCVVVTGGEFWVREGSSCFSSTDARFDIRVDVGSKTTGVIQEVGDKARFGFMWFDDEKTLENGAEVKTDIGDNVVSMVNAIEGMRATSSTPLAESAYEAIRYFAQIPPAYESTDFQISANADPYCFDDEVPPAGESGCKTSTVGRWVPCCKNFVILFTDGEPTQDFNSSPAKPGENALRSFGQTGPHCAVLDCDANDDWYPDEGSHMLDDVAYFGHTVDIRASTIDVLNEPGQDLPGKQVVTFYMFFAFGNGSQLLRDAARGGGFEDVNGNGIPDLQAEWDRNGDGVPDTYFESQNAYDMRERLVAAITDILQRSASGTSVSVLATSSGGEGAIYQAYFYPSLFEGVTEVAWLGYLQGLFFDQQGRLREDTDGDGRLVLSRDRIVETFFDPNTRETKVRRYAVDADGNKSGAADVVTLRELLPVWEAGKVLALRDTSANPRTIMTWVDGDGDGVVDGGEYIPFTTANEATLRPYLRAADSAEGTSIIDFIRGEQVSGYRSREVLVDGSLRTWRLGDIVYSSPVSVGAPAERFDLKYGDASYNRFFEKYRNRRHVVYVGANDGMLHAFNAGFFHRGDDPDTTGVVEHSWFSTTPDGSTGGKALGEELWAYIPQALLPHLKWLTQSEYDKSQHVYYVDGTPRVADVRIFTEEAACASNLADPGCVHPGGWGTVLIGSMRLGGGLIRVDLNGDGDTTDAGESRFRSGYFALDITDPDRTPQLLWAYTDHDLGFTTSWPAILRFDATTWYAVFGSGPLTYRGERNASLGTNKFDATASEYGRVFVVDLATGAEVAEVQLDSTDRYAFMGDPVAYDLAGNDAFTDVLYIGKTYYASGWKGKVHRILLTSADFSTYDAKVLVDPARPVLAKPTASVDRFNALWIYFGTGRYFSTGDASDQTDTSVQALYGIREVGANGCWTAAGAWKTSCPTSPVPIADLVDVTGAVVSEGGALTCSTCGGGGSTLGSLITYVRSKQGWVLYLDPGERVLHESTVLGGVVLATTFEPGTDICVPQGTNTLFAMYYETGTAFSEQVIGIAPDGTTVKRTADLGQGVASKVNVVVSDDTVTGFVQSSTGEILQVHGIKLASNVRAGIRAWREETE